MKTAFRWFIFSVSHVEDFHGRAGRIEVWCFFVFECLFLVLAAGIDLLFTGFPIVLPIYAALHQFLPFFYLSAACMTAGFRVGGFFLL